jgi:hypothetical protein
MLKMLKIKDNNTQLTVPKSWNCNNDAVCHDLQSYTVARKVSAAIRIKMRESGGTVSHPSKNEKKAVWKCQFCDWPWSLARGQFFQGERKRFLGWTGTNDLHRNAEDLRKKSGFSKSSLPSCCASIPRILIIQLSPLSRYPNVSWLAIRTLMHRRQHFPSCLWCAKTPSSMVCLWTNFCSFAHLSLFSCF